jgi:hypothetical protein
MADVMRAAAQLLLVLAVVAGCSMVPAVGSRPVVAQVKNSEIVPVELTIETPAGVIHGAVQPASVAARGSAEVTFFLPPGDDWWIVVSGSPMFPATDVLEYAKPDCGSLQMEVSTDGSGSIGCSP